jgi:hypothetical protein
VPLVTLSPLLLLLLLPLPPISDVGIASVLGDTEKEKEIEDIYK